MIIGIDFDNTIACHDQSFRKIAIGQRLSIPEGKKPKQVVKDFFLGKENGNLEWTQVQGKIYGENLPLAKLFACFAPFVEKANSLGHKLFVISHRTQFPAWGNEIDLHKAALEWLSVKGLLSPDSIPLENCFFETSLEKKIERIKKESCSMFIDDLEVVLEHSEFPAHTQKVLFGKAHGTLPFLLSWDKAEELLNNEQTEFPRASAPPRRTLPFDQHLECFGKLLQEVGKSKPTAMQQVKRGGNNCVYKIETGNELFFGKVYHRDAVDSRDRLGQEVAFSKYLQSMQIKESPSLIAEDQSCGTACFEWIEGADFETGSTLPNELWEQCFSFLKKIQNGEKTFEAQNLPNGSESAFSLRGHFALLQNRRDYWHFHNDTIPEEIRIFLLNNLDQEYKSLAKELISHPDFNKELEANEKIISPSDFGLHNAKLGEDGKLAFFDFEYAGWDDPAKTVADFFAQPKFPAPYEEVEKLLSTFSEFFSEQTMEKLQARLPLVSRVIRLKWCYISLNDYHPVSRERRKLSGKKLNSVEETLNLMNEFIARNPLVTNSL